MLDSIPPFKVGKSSSHAYTALWHLAYRSALRDTLRKRHCRGPGRLTSSHSLHPLAMQGCARADAVVAESGSDRRIKCLLARVTGIPVLKRSFLDRSIFSASMC